MTKNTLLACVLASLVATPAVISACPRTSPAQALPLGVASTDSSQITFSLSNKGNLAVRRTLSLAVPAGAASCSVTLEGRYSRKLSYSGTKTLGIISSTSSVVNFRAKKLPAVRADRFRRQTIQPSLHVRVKTSCIDKDGGAVFSDTTPVVARYVECGSSKKPVSMATFVETLIEKLENS